MYRASRKEMLTPPNLSVFELRQLVRPRIPLKRSHTPPRIYTAADRVERSRSPESCSSPLTPLSAAQPSTASSAAFPTPRTRAIAEASVAGSPLSARLAPMLNLRRRPALPDIRRSTNVKDIAVGLSWYAITYSVLGFALERLVGSLHGTAWKHFDYIWQGRATNAGTLSWDGVLCSILVIGLVWRIRKFSILYAHFSIQIFTVMACIVLACMPIMHWFAINTWECLWNRRGFAVIGKRIISRSLGDLFRLAILYVALMYRNHIIKIARTVWTRLPHVARRQRQGMEHYPIVAAIKARDKLMEIAAFFDRHLEKITSFSLVQWLDARAAAIFRLLAFLGDDPEQAQDTPVASFGAYPLTPSVASTTQQSLGSSGQLDLRDIGV